MTDPAALTECPKCTGSGVVAFKHVEGGRCFLCDGARKVDAATASRWLASQLGSPRRQMRARRAPTPIEYVAMDLDLGPVFGTVEIRHSYELDARGEFTARLGTIRDGWQAEYSFGPDGGYCVRFTVARGRVSIPRERLQNGMLHNGRVRALQTALEAAI